MYKNKENLTLTKSIEIKYDKHQLNKNKKNQSHLWSYCAIKRKRKIKINQND